MMITNGESLREEALNEMYMNLAGAIIRSVCDEYIEALKKVNSERSRRDCDLTVLMRDVEYCERYFRSADCELLSLGSGDAVVAACRRQAKEYFTKKRKPRLNPEDIIWNMSDAQKFMIKRRQEQIELLKEQGIDKLI